MSPELASVNENSLRVLNSTRLPVLPAGIPELLNSLSNDSLTFEELSQAIEHFPTIAARLLVVSNSAWAAPIRPIESLSAACSRLGVSVVKSISIALAVASPFTLNRCPSFNVPHFWCRSLLVADLASSFALLSGEDVNAEMLRTAGLLHNLGLLWLADQLSDDVNQVLILHKNNSESKLGELLIERLGFDYAQAGSFLGKEWGLPASLLSAIECHRKPELYLEQDKNIHIIGHAVAIAQAIENSDDEEVKNLIGHLFASSSIEVDEQFERVMKVFKKNQALTQALF